jgi:cytidylate kinase
MSSNVVTIDGPSGSGKGTVAVLLAKYLGYNYLDSGVHFRALGYLALKQSVSSDDEPALIGLLETMQLQMSLNEDFSLNVTLNGEDVSTKLRNEDVANFASKIAIHKGVRSKIVDIQRGFLQGPGLVTDGRDMGTVVFPEAKWKIYLSVSLEVAAQRRYEQLKKQGINVSLGDVLSKMKQRDMRDCKRKVAPLEQALDAYFLDTDNLTVEQVVDKARLFIEASSVSG